MRQATTTEVSSATSAADGSAHYKYTQPFLQPAPVWDYWFALLLPLLVAICIVYKTVKVGHVRQLPREAAGMFTWLIIALTGASLALWLFVKVTG